MLKPEQQTISHDDQGEFCNAILAPYAVKPFETKGRLHDEKESTRRSPFERDRDRIIHSRSFRRLKHKTQVFTANTGDHYRTRLTHSMEVAQVARSLARTLRLNEDLAETIALAHDLGHTPFAHLGEDVLRECLAKRDSWFNHNEHTFRIVTKLEKQYPSFDGLNLTWESLEGIAKHNGPLKDEADHPLQQIIDYSTKDFDLLLGGFPSAEAQLAGVADDIAYNNHDLDDGLRAGFFTLDDVAKNIPHTAATIQAIKKKYPDMEEKRLVSALIRDLIGDMIEDLIAETGRRLSRIKPKSVDDVRQCGEMVVGFSDKFIEQDKVMRKFLWNNMYLHSEVERTRVKMGKVIRDLFNIFMETPSCMPLKWYKMVEVEGHERTVLDYVAGMTDIYAIEEHRKLFNPYHRN